MTWARFFDMGGYAFYVWGSFGVALFLMGAEVLLLCRRSKRARLQQPSQAHDLNALKENETTT